MSPERMVTMVNQIAMFFGSQPGSDAVHHVVEHLKDFWEPRMREQLREYALGGGDGLLPIAAEAARLLPPVGQ